MGVFSHPDDLERAARAACENGYRPVETYSPIPVTGMPDGTKGRPALLSVVSLASAATALVFMTWACLWTSSISWPVNIGGKPWNSLPAYIPVIFEVTILAAALVPTILFLAKLPFSPSRRYTDAAEDEFVLVLEVEDSRYSAEELENLLRSHSAVRIEQVD